MPIVLGLESSCDETAAAIARDADVANQRLMAHRLASQIDQHAVHGGVVPEIAARAHLDAAPALVDAVLDAVPLSAVDAIAASAGPGLIGGLLVGSSFAKGLAQASGKPFMAINHLEGHVLSPRLVGDLPFPYLALLVSGGHCQIVEVRGLGDYRTLGATIDDAVGEAFDKSAKMLGLGYPGGPALERAAADGDPARYALPRPLLGRPGCDFSFSGLKTAVRRTLEGEPGAAVADLAAGFQAAVCDVLADRLKRALKTVSVSGVAVVGGVAANQAIRARLAELCDAADLPLHAPPLWLCGDNAAMIAWAGVERAQTGLFDPLDAPCHPRWPLDALSKEIPCSTG